MMKQDNDDKHSMTISQMLKSLEGAHLPDDNFCPLWSMIPIDKSGTECLVVFVEPMASSTKIGAVISSLKQFQRICGDIPVFFNIEPKEISSSPRYQETTDSMRPVRGVVSCKGTFTVTDGRQHSPFE